MCVCVCVCVLKRSALGAERESNEENFLFCVFLFFAKKKGEDRKRGLGFGGLFFSGGNDPTRKKRQISQK
jgi:hypothetical protein